MRERKGRERGRQRAKGEKGGRERMREGEMDCPRYGMCI